MVRALRVQLAHAARGGLHAFVASVVATLPLVCLIYCNVVAAVSEAYQRQLADQEWCHPPQHTIGARTHTSHPATDVPPDRGARPLLSHVAELASNFLQILLPVLREPLDAMQVVSRAPNPPSPALFAFLEPPPLPPPELCKHPPLLLDTFR